MKKISESGTFGGYYNYIDDKQPKEKVNQLIDKTMRQCYDLAKDDTVRRFEIIVKNKMFPDAKVKCLATIKKLNYNNEVIYQIEGQQRIDTNMIESEGLQVAFK
jgi:hypothetical protein